MFSYLLRRYSFLFYRGKVIIFSVTDNVSTHIIVAKSLQIVLAATMFLHNNLLVASYMKDEAAKLSAMAFNMILKRDLVISRLETIIANCDLLNSRFAICAKPYRRQMRAMGGITHAAAIHKSVTCGEARVSYTYLYLYTESGVVACR